MDIMGATTAEWPAGQSRQVTAHSLPAPAPVMAHPTGIDWSDHFAHAAQTSVLICTGDTAPAGYAAQLPAMARAAGHRIIDVLPIHAAAEHISRLIALDAVILSCSGQDTGLDTLLARLDSMADAGSISLLVITDLAGLDRVHALVHSRSTIILCEPEPIDVAVAIMVLAEHGPGDTQLHDIGNEAEVSHFDLLSDQLLKLNRMIEALVQDKTAEDNVNGLWGRPSAAVKSPSRSYSAASEDEAVSSHKVYAHQVRALLRARRLREQILSPDLFADPAWDILLDLLAARLENTRVSVSSLCIAAAVPPTTALRWIRQLTDRGLLERQADPRDGRRIFIGLSDSGSAAVLRWFQQSRAHFQAALATDA